MRILHLGPGASIGRTIAIFAAVSLAVPVAGAAPPDVACSVPGQVVVEPDGWTRIRAPQFPFPDGFEALSDYAVDPIAPNRMFVTNGRTVLRSIDGGCTWSQAYRIDDLPSEQFPFVAATTRILDIVIPASAGAHDRVYLVLMDGAVLFAAGGADAAAEVARPHVVRSLNGGETWEAADAGLLPQGIPLALLVADTAPNTLYLFTLVGPRAGTGGYPSVSANGRFSILFVSRDGGGTWNRIGPITMDSSGNTIQVPPEFKHVAIDPLDPQELWGATRDGLWRSRDGGARWLPLPEIDVAGPISVVDVFHAPGAPARIWAFGPGDSFRSDDGGGVWRRMAGMPSTSVVLTSAAHGEGANHLFAATALDGSGGWAMGFNASTGGWDVLKQASEALRGASADRASPPSFYARTSDRIYRSPPGAGGFKDPGFVGGQPPVPPGLTNCNIKDAQRAPDPPVPGAPLLSPAQKTVVLPPGGLTTVRYELEVPARPRPVDLFFLIDASASMGGALCGAANGSLEIAEVLVGAGVDVWFGAGTYQEHPPGPDLPCYSYRLDRQMAPLDRDLSHALRSIQECRGRAEPQMTALVQAATGTGQPPSIQPGQDADFRQESLDFAEALVKPMPVIVHISDENTVNDLEPRPWPIHNTEQEAIQALRAEDIRQVGVSVERFPPGSQYNATAWLRRVASATKGIAEPPGIDCDGDGAIDVPAGGPAVCVVLNVATGFGIPMANAVTEMVMALKDDAPVRLEESSDSGVVDGIEPDGNQVVNLKKDNLLDFEVTYSCEHEQVGGPFPVELVAKIRGDAVATATALVTCLGIPGPTLPPIVGVAVAPGVVAPPPPPLPPPVAVIGPAPALAPGLGPQPQPQPNPNPNPNPQTNPQSNPQTQGQAQAQAAMAVQQQKQTQTALATAGQQVSGEEEYAMSVRRTSDPVDDARWPIAIGGGVLALAFGCLSRAHRRTQVARIRRRTR